LNFLDFPEGVGEAPTPKWEMQAMARVIDREKRKADPTFKGAFHEKKRKPGSSSSGRKRRSRRRPS